MCFLTTSKHISSIASSILFFLAPLAGYALANLSGYGSRFRQTGKNWLLGLAICLVLFGVGIGQARNLFNEWVNTDNLVNVLKTQVRNGSGNILAEESEVPRYYLQNIVLIAVSC